MNKLAVLGPKGTFSENAAIEYEKTINKTFDKQFYNSIPLTFSATGNDCELGIVPVENTLDGYVQRSLDLLLELDLQIVDEVIIPVQFSLVSNCKNKEDIKNIFVQFKAHGQCLKVINELKDANIKTTQSNTQSFELLKKSYENSCAIIPSHRYKDIKNTFSIENATDSQNNCTRFFVISKIKQNVNLAYDKQIKVSLYILPSSDRAGMLYEILEKFYKNDINLCSIISRPTKKDLGTYNFYIELIIEHNKHNSVLNTINELNKEYNIKVLGMYNI